MPEVNNQYSIFNKGNSNINAPPVVPAQLLAGPHEGGGKEGNPGESEVMGVNEDVLHEDIGIAAVIQVAADVASPLGVHDVRFFIRSEQLSH